MNENLKNAMVRGSIMKRTWCPSCFKVITWETSDIEKNNKITCPNCKAAINYAKAEIIFKDYLENDDIKTVVNGIAYQEDQIQNALDTFSEQGGNLILNSDISTEKQLLIDGKEAVIDLNGHNLTLSKFPIKAKVGSNLTIKGTGKIIAEKDFLQCYKSNITINGGEIEAAECGIAAYSESRIVMNDGKITSKEGCITPYDKSTFVMNGGRITSTDNYAIGTSGTKSENGRPKTIIINGGHIYSKKPSTEGYISCGIYLASDAKITLNGGDINSLYGCGILMRAGTLTCNKCTISGAGGKEVQGKVGDSQQLIKCNAIAYDTLSNYPDKNTLKVIVNGGRLTSPVDKIGLYINPDEKPNIINKLEKSS